MPTTTAQPSTGPRRALLIAGAVVLAAATCIFAIPGSGSPSDAILAVIGRLVYAAPAPAAFLLAGVGLGRLARPLFRGSKDPFALQVSLGIGALLFLTHLLGCLSILGGDSGPIIAIALVTVGCGLAIEQFIRTLRGGGFEPSITPLGILSLAAVAILLVAACNPPGALWGSEFGGYDVLEYHLELPQEWLLAGKITPQPHNVYSYLPSYLESAYTFLGHLTAAPRSGRGPIGLLAGEGDRLISCQLLHAGFTILAAWLTARFADRLANIGKTGKAAVFGLVLATPWSIVTGSMAYNEMALIFFFSGAGLAAVEVGIPRIQRALITGFLAGIAASVKPTGLLFVGAPVGLLLLGLSRPKDWLWLILAGSAAGLAAIAPWLVRNHLAAGNPVFPFAASLFPNNIGGTGPWTKEQVTRFASAHHFDGTLLDRFKLLIIPESTPKGPNHRGMLHAQWGLLFPFTLLATVRILWQRRSDKAEGTTHRTLPLLAAGLLVQSALWLFTTHLQSRFLMPLVVPSAILCGAAAAQLARLNVGVRWLGPAAAAVPVLVQLGFTGSTFLNEQNGNPNRQLIYGPAYRTGQLLAGEPRSTVEAALNVGPPDLFTNMVLTPGDPILLLGDATPLYFTRPVRYSTTYDTSPFSGVPVDQWTRVIRAMHIEFVLINLSEIKRLEKSGWNPPGITLDAAEQWLQQPGMQLMPTPARWANDGLFLVFIKGGATP